jgi:ketosteroid isomerase-like protein
MIVAIVASAACGHSTSEPPSPPATPVAKPAPKADPYEVQTKWLRSFADSYNTHDLDKLGRLYTDDAVLVELGAQGLESRGRARVVLDYKSIFDAFPDAKMAITRSWHVNDIVVFEYIEGGTNTADVEGVKATKKPYGMVGASILWFTPDGLVKREQVYSDEMTMEHQTGMLDPTLAKIEVRPLIKVPEFTGTWEQHRARGDANEAGITKIREKLYTAFEMSSDREFLAMMTDDIVMAAYDDDKDSVGKAEVGAQIHTWIKMIANLKFDAELSWGCDGYAIVQGKFSGKHVGPWGPIKPTQKEFTTHFLDISRLTKDGKVDRMWTYASNAELLHHIGIRNVAQK